MNRLIICVSIVAYIFVCPVKAQNLVSNGDFSEGIAKLDNWEAVGDITIGDPDATGNKAFVLDSYYSGAETDVLTIQTSGSANDGAGRGVGQNFYIGADSDYTLSFKFGYSNIGSYSSITLNYRDINGDPIPDGGYFQWTFNWQTEPDPNPNDTIYNNQSPGLMQRRFVFARGEASEVNSRIIPENARYVYITLKQHFDGYRTFFDDIYFAAGANLVMNGSFDQTSEGGIYGFYGWEPTHEAFQLVDEAEAGTGKGWIIENFQFSGETYDSVFCIQTSSATNDGSGRGVIQNMIPIGNDDAYTLSLDIGFSNIGHHSFLLIRYYNINKVQISSGSYFQFRFNWLEAGPESNVVYTNNSGGMVTRDFTFTRGALVSGNSQVIPEDTAYITLNLSQQWMGYRTYFDNVKLLAIPQECGEPGTVYVDSDVNKDCLVDIADFAELARFWGFCNDPEDEDCDDYWK